MKDSRKAAKCQFAAGVARDISYLYVDFDHSDSTPAVASLGSAVASTLVRVSLSKTQPWWCTPVLPSGYTFLYI